VESQIDGKVPLRASFSTVSHNRVAVVDGAVEKIFGDNGIFSVNIDSGTGNAFVTVLRDVADIPATLSVMTSSGSVQDLLITTHQGPSEQILLLEPEEKEPLSTLQACHTPTVELLNALLEDKTPLGYQLTSSKEEGPDLPNPLEIRLLKNFEGPFDAISVFEIQNLGMRDITLTPEALKTENSSWVFLDSRQLGRMGRALCIIGRTK